MILALVLALFTSEFLLGLQQASWSLAYSGFGGFIETIERIVAVFTDAGNARLLIFATMIGAVLALMRFSGGINATVQIMVNSGLATNARRTSFMTMLTGVVIFIESNLSVLTAGILSRGLFDRFNMSRERLAFIIDSTSAPICILILLNGWGAFVLGILAPYDMSQTAVQVLLGTIPLNFYPLLVLLTVFYTAWSGKVHGPLAALEAQHQSVERSLPAIENVVKTEGRARDMLVPLATIVLSMLGFMLWTGDGDIMAGSGSKSVLYATLLAFTVSYLMLLARPQFKHLQLLEEGFKGVAEIMPLVIILLLSIALGASVKQLGTGVFISGLVADYLPLWLVPAMVFIAGAFAAYHRHILGYIRFNGANWHSNRT